MDKSLLLNRLRQLGLIFAVGFLCGCIYFNMLWHLSGYLFQNEWGILLDHWIEIPLKRLSVLPLEIFLEILFFQGVVFVLGLLKIGKIILQGSFFCFGILTGAMETLLLLSCDLRIGMWFLLKIIIAYGFLSFLLSCLIVLSTAMSGAKKMMPGKTKKWKWIQIKKYLLYFCWMFILFMIYIFFCSYITKRDIRLTFL